MSRVAAEAEAQGWDGLLVPHNLREFDPWMIAAHLGSVSTTLRPLIALQPESMPPHTAASLAAAFAEMHGRPVDFNLVAGADEAELRSVGCDLDHDRRYDRLLEYAVALRSMLDGAVADTPGKYYRYARFELHPHRDPLRQSNIFVAGSSDAGVRVAAAAASVAVTHPGPFEQWRTGRVARLREAGFRGDFGIRIGLLARDETKDAWEVAARRFPQTWKGRQLTLLKTRSPNQWARDLAELASDDSTSHSHGTFWPGAFASGLASAPYLVGSVEDVAAALRRYVDEGVRHVILAPTEAADLPSISSAIKLVASGRA